MGAVALPAVRARLQCLPWGLEVEVKMEVEVEVAKDFSSGRPPDRNLFSKFILLTLYLGGRLTLHAQLGDRIPKVPILTLTRRRS